MRPVKVAGVICITIMVCACVWPQEKREKEKSVGQEEIVERIIDGDTLCLVGGERIRLVGIDAPPLSAMDGSGRRAMEFLENLCPPGTRVYIDRDDIAGEDCHGRTLAVVYVFSQGDLINVNAELLRSGNAAILFIPPTEFSPYAWIGGNS